MAFRTLGPWEPSGFEALRDAYWQQRVWLNQIEARISCTDSGLAWLYRVKAIGYRREGEVPRWLDLEHT